MSEGLIARYRRRADQQWELAGLSRREGDLFAVARHTENAKKYDRMARQAANGEPVEDE